MAPAAGPEATSPRFFTKTRGAQATPCPRGAPAPSAGAGGSSWLLGQSSVVMTSSAACSSSSAATGHSQFLVTEIPTAETSASERWKPVTLYVVRITALGRSEVWTVYRRYSKFYDLNVQLQKRFVNHALPPLPPKRFIGKEDPQFIEQRRGELENFLNALLKKPVEISLSEEVCLFLEVPEPLRLCFLESDARAPALPPLPGAAGAQPGGVGLCGGDPDECRVVWLLKSLADNPNSKVFFIRTFEDWVLRTNPPLTETSAQVLYLGIERQGGLLEEVGAFEHSEVSSVAALGLLAKLLSHEFCSDAPLFRAVLSRLDQSVLSRMRLQHHIHRNRGQNNRLDAFHVLRSLDLPADRLAALLQDDFSLREFQRWHESLQSSLSFRTLHRPSQTRNGVPSSLEEAPRRALSTREYRKIAETSYTSVQMCFTTFLLPPLERSPTAAGGGRMQGARESAAGSRDVPHRSHVCEQNQDFARDGDRGANLPAGPEVTPIPSREHSHWHHVPCPEPAWVAKYGMHAAYQRVPSEQQSDEYVVRAAMRLPFSALMVACALADHSQLIRNALALRATTDMDITDVRRLEQLAGSHLISQMQSSTTIRTLHLGTAHEAYSELQECDLGTPSAPHVPIRLWLLRSVRIIPEQRLLAGSASSGDISPGFFSGSASGEDARGDIAFATGSQTERTHGNSHGRKRSSSAGDGEIHSGEHRTSSHGFTRKFRGSPRSEDGRRSSSGGSSEAAPHEPQPSYLFLCAGVPPVAVSAHDDVEANKGMAMGGSRGASLSSSATHSATALAVGEELSLPVALADQLVTPPTMPHRLFAHAPSPRSRSGPSGGVSSPRLVGVKPSGILVQPAPGGSGSEVTMCALLNKESVRLVSGDLLGERLLFWRTLENLLFVLETLGTLPKDFDHSLRRHRDRCLSQDRFTGGNGERGSRTWHRPTSPSSRDSACSRCSSRSSARSLEVELIEGGSTFT